MPSQLPRPLSDLISAWSSEAALFRRRGQEATAALLESVILDLEAAWREHWAEELSLSQASVESGYSVDHLGRQLLAGRIPNAGEKGQPRIRRADLPRRVAARHSGKYDPDADARNLLTLRKEHS